MDYVWYLFSFEGRINRARYWLATLIIVCWMIFLGALTIGLVVLFGGTAPAVALYFKTLGHEHWFYYYLSGMIFLSLLIYATMRDTKHASAMHRHE